MKTLIVGKDLKEITKIVKSLGLPAGRQGFEVVKDKPELVISYGGDGTLIHAERHYPGVPKLPMRNSKVCKKCPEHGDEVILKKLIQGSLQLKEYGKLETEVLHKTFYSLNDFVIRNSNPTHTIRFTTSASDELLIGDGVVIATPFGSSGYFKSITGKTLEEGLPADRQGFGVAFNNTTEKVDPLNLGDNETLTFQLIRGKATLSFDNSPEIFTIDEGSKLVFKLSNQIARIYEDTSLRCPNCVVNRG